VADRLGLIPEERYCPVWITSFPLFELKDGKVTSQHHPFTMPDRTDFDPTDAMQNARFALQDGENIGLDGWQP